MLVLLLKAGAETDEYAAETADAEDACGEKLAGCGLLLRRRDADGDEPGWRAAVESGFVAAEAAAAAAPVFFAATAAFFPATVLPTPRPPVGVLFVVDEFMEAATAALADTTEAVTESSSG